MGFVWSDAWLLYSIIAAARDADATLVDVIAVGDFVNHAIFTKDKINGGLERLEHAGLVSLSGEFMHPSHEAVEMYSRASLATFSALEVVEHLSDLLGVGRQAVDPPASLRFDADEVNAAYREYHERFQRYRRELHERDS